MGKVIRAKDWSRTPLGPIEQWPQSLRTAVSICLASNFPINIIWGPGRVQIYNDGYWPICGDKHPYSMGQDYKECWFSAWDAVGQPFENASAGQTDFLVNQRMFLDRHGYLEETFFTFSLSPIRDESGGVGGCFLPVTEMTQQTLAERRLKALRDLADNAAEAKTVDAACQAIAGTLAEHALDVPFALLYLLDAGGAEARLAASAGIAAGSPASPPVVDLGAAAQTWWPLAQAVHDRRDVVVDEIDRRFGPLACGAGGPYPETPQRALVLPITLSGFDSPFGLLVAGVSARRALDDAYRTFYVMLREGVTNALTNARAYEEERKRAEALAEIDRAKTTFFSNVSHEFRTPLTLLLGPLEELLADPATLPATAREQLDVAHRNALRLLKLVNSLLDFSRLEAGRIQAVYEPVDLANYTAELASVFRSAIERAGLRLVVDCPPLPEGATAYVDREMWEKIVFNLLSNAFKFTFDGEIAVALRVEDEGRRTEDGTTKDEGRRTQDEAPPAAPGSPSVLRPSSAPRVVLAVRDTGAGVPPEELPHLFERFHRVKGARGRSYEGTGIGLALVQELVRLHSGTVEVASELDRGSIFSVSIPLGAAHVPAERIGAERTLASTGVRGAAYVQEALRWLSEDREPDRGARERMAMASGPLLDGRAQQGGTLDGPPPRVLLADDNADMRDYVRRLLAPQYDVVAVGNGEAALEAAREGQFDLLIADVMMPRLDGFQLLAALRADPRTRTLPVVLLSARAGEESRVEGMEAGANDYLVKPFSARELLARVAAHLEMARVRSEAEAIRERLIVAEAVAAERQALLKRIVQLQEEERQHIAHEVHDGVTQLAHAAALRLDGEIEHLAPALPPDDLQELQAVQNLTRQAANEARRLIAGLRPAALDAYGLAGAVQQEVDALRGDGWPVQLDDRSLRGVRLDPDVEITLYRVAQEALTNVRKHAGTVPVRVRLSHRAGAVCLEVRDRGRGFDTTAVRGGALGERVGLTGMRERLALLGGRLEVRSSPRTGTAVRATLPLPAAERTPGDGTGRVIGRKALASWRGRGVARTPGGAGRVPSAGARSATADRVRARPLPGSGDGAARPPATGGGRRAPSPASRGSA